MTVSAETANLRMQQSLKKFLAGMASYVPTVVKPKLVTTMKSLGFTALARFVMRTPVKLGRARGNWQVDINRSPTESLLVLDKGGGATIQKGNNIIAGVEFGQDIHIVNNLSYIIALEAGHSKQRAAHGIVALTLEELFHVFA